jgi:hypothetical protein
VTPTVQPARRAPASEREGRVRQAPRATERRVAARASFSRVVERLAWRSTTAREARRVPGRERPGAPAAPWCRPIGDRVAGLRAPHGRERVRAAPEPTIGPGVGASIRGPPGGATRTPRGSRRSERGNADFYASAVHVGA